MLIRALVKVFRRPAYVLLTLGISAFVFAFSTWFMNLRLLGSVIGSPDYSFSQKLALPISLLGSIATNFTLLSSSYTIAIAILFGMYISMLTYFLKQRIKEVGQGEVAAGFLGLTSGVLGVGCAACGSFLLTSLSLVGLSGVLTFLPLRGGEFGIIGALLLGVAVYLTAKKIQNPAVCRVTH